MTQRPWWKAYFFFAVVITAIGIAASFVFADEMEMSWPEYLFFVLYVVQIVGLFGFVFGRRIAKPMIWQWVFVATVAYELWNGYQTATDTELAASFSFFLAGLFIAIYLTQMPMWFGLFHYGFRCKELWRRAA
jgi:hypothetical protein